jgi:hypothetical protein
MVEGNADLDFSGFTGTTACPGPLVSSLFHREQQRRARLFCFCDYFAVIGLG